jgi:hypothetical protein
MVRDPYALTWNFHMRSMSKFMQFAGTIALKMSYIQLSV